MQEIFNSSYALIMGISAIVAIYGAVNAFNKKSNADPSADTAIRNWIFTCIGLVILLAVLKVFFYP